MLTALPLTAGEKGRRAFELIPPLPDFPRREHGARRRHRR